MIDFQNPIIIYGLAVTVILAVSAVANVYSYFEAEELRRSCKESERQLTILRMQLRKIPQASKIIRGLPRKQFRLITNDKAGNIISKLLSPKKGR